MTTKRAFRSDVRLKRVSDAGFTILELIIVVFIIGVLCAIAVPAYSTYVKRSRVGEVAQSLNKMWAGSVAYYQADRVNSAGAPVPRQFPGPTAAAEPDCCLSPDARCPGNDPIYSTDVWNALGINLPSPHFYRPSFTSAGADANATFTAQVNGDLDCDSTVSYFAREGSIDPSSGDVTSNGIPSAILELE